jgi:hypothetical protein
MAKRALPQQLSYNKSVIDFNAILLLTTPPPSNTTASVNNDHLPQREKPNQGLPISL